MNKFITYIFSIASLYLTVSCSKGWLEEKRDIKLIVPTTLNDMDLLLNADVFQSDGRGATETACDDYDFTLEQYNALYNAFDRDLVIWKTQEFPKFGILVWDEWDMAYSQIQVCNVVLNGLSKINRTNSNKEQYDKIKGTALYHRAKQFLNLALTFCKYYDYNTAETELGIPLKLTEDIDEIVDRGSLKKTYDRIVSDLKESAILLPSASTINTQIAKAGAYGLLARTYLFMDDYKQASSNADSSFKYHSYIEDFNKIDLTSDYPFYDISKEIHIYSMQSKYSPNSITGRINQALIESYNANDLRKQIFYKVQSDGKYTFKGSFTAQLFSGTSTGEILLISAECRARLGDFEGGLEKIKLLLQNRFKTGAAIPMPTKNKHDVLSFILLERRKELVTRGLRWQDLKRLNNDIDFAQTLTRTIGENTYTLPPKDPRYIMRIPQYIINYNHITQNSY
ncbi:RagB/SusD family nutrient uptake outer membrane protein [Chryseobacterium sp. AG363]|uniref:RagB/SusD family nutrient uptake outer membrane protein n=1 Tax=Chryseobacterium sp. AG363 TaxID=2183997 RepID=UPI000E76ECB4|nr:RagB/SusD family nutrient uptake outer membrane protein [Chryseobacterium sp. AG363]RKE80829.1 SusD-like starch-binding protein associating with outer membrane [Chryseobacterium sp. AG363]